MINSLAKIQNPNTSLGELRTGQKYVKDKFFTGLYKTPSRHVYGQNK